MVVWSWYQSLSPGNEQLNMWTSKAADTSGSGNACGIKNPAIDEVVNNLIKAKTRKNLVIQVQVLDRILSANHYVIPHWYAGYNRAIYWNKFSFPKKFPGKASFTTALINWWWYDKTKAEISRIIDIPDLKLDRIIRCISQNKGVLGGKMRRTYFSELSDEVIQAIETVVQEHMLE